MDLMIVRRFLLLFFVLSIVTKACTASDIITNMIVDKKSYGAKANKHGSIGGSNGYLNTIVKGDYIVNNLEELIDSLSKVKKGEIVFIPGEVEIDLTSLIYIEELVLEIPEGVTLAGNRGFQGSKGALLGSDALKTPVLLRIMGPDVRITGLRIQGPNPKRYLDHHKRSLVRKAYYYRFPVSAGIVTKYSSLEVDNCEISGFSHAGISLVKGDRHHIHHNYIHHCQYAGLGYGVSHDESSSIIEYNLFDWNRHSIAGTGKVECGYIARHNVELGESLSHCFDMHGGRDRKDGTAIAGSSIEIYNNTFFGLQHSVVIRGVPQEKCEIHHNWFPAHGCQQQAIQARKSNKTTITSNLYGDLSRISKQRKGECVTIIPNKHLLQ